MQAHAHATRERMQAPAQMLRGVTGPCACPVDGGMPSRVLRGSIRREAGRDDLVGGTIPPRTSWGSGSDRDFGSSVGGGPV